MNEPHIHAALIHAWADGAVIQRYSGALQEWRSTTDNKPVWDEHTKYRVAPEAPEEVWVNVYPNGKTPRAHSTEDKALYNKGHYCIGTFRYVLAEDGSDD